jgi:hypothetical protein
MKGPESYGMGGGAAKKVEKKIKPEKRHEFNPADGLEQYRAAERVHSVDDEAMEGKADSRFGIAPSPEDILLAREEAGRPELFDFEIEHDNDPGGNLEQLEKEEMDQAKKDIQEQYASVTRSLADNSLEESAPMLGPAPMPSQAGGDRQEEKLTLTKEDAKLERHSTVGRGTQKYINKHQKGGQPGNILKRIFGWQAGEDVE